VCRKYLGFDRGEVFSLQLESCSDGLPGGDGGRVGAADVQTRVVALVRNALRHVSRHH
jgi:hypothetical protein